MSNTDVIEDEMHFLMSCNAHQHERPIVNGCTTE